MTSWLKWLPIAVALLAAAVVLRLPLGSTAAPSATITVTDTGQDDPADPNRDSNGTCTLAEAIRAANADAAVDQCNAGSGADTIQLSGSTYTLSFRESIFDGNNGTESVTSPITIEGVAGSTVIQRASGADEPFRLLQVRSNGTLIVTDLTLKDGNLEGFGGAAIDVQGGVLTVTNVLLTENTAPYGGAIANSSGEIWIAESEFTENSTPFTDTNAGLGGAIYSGGGTVHVLSSTFATNSAYNSGGAIYSANGASLFLALVNVTANIANADSVGGGLGAGIYNNADVNIAGGEISGNQVLPSATDPWDGGGIWSGGSTVITGTVITTNSADNGGGYFHQGGGDAFVDYAIITSNAAADEGGGVWNGGTLHLTDSNVATNAAGARGGGIANSRRLDLRNSTVTANTAGSDGGGVAELGTPQTIDTSVVNSTISTNSAAGNGGGLWVGTDGRLLLANATVANNTAISGASLFNAGVAPNAVTRNSILYAPGASCNAPITSQGYNVENGASCGLTGTGDQNADPLLGPLGTNGGPTLTHALMQGSPAVDAGDPTGCLDDDAMVLTEDQRGSPRPVDGNNDLDPRCDSGAYEAPSGTGATVTPTPSNTPTATTTPTTTATPAATTTPTTTATATATVATGTPTTTATATATVATGTPTNTATGTATVATGTPTNTATATPTVTPGGPTLTPTSTGTATPTLTPTSTGTATPTITPSSTASTATPATSTPTPSITPGGPTLTPSLTPSVTATITPSSTASTATPATATPSITPSSTASTATPATATPSITPSGTPGGPTATPTLPPTSIELGAIGVAPRRPTAPLGALVALVGMALVVLGARRRG